MFFSKQRYALNSPAVSNLEGFLFNATNAAHFLTIGFILYSHGSGILNTIAHKWGKDLQ